MPTPSFIKTVCLTIAILLGSGSPAFAQDDDQQSKTELGLRQQLVQLKMQEVEKQFRAIATRLEKERPEQAKLLTAAYQQSKEQLITVKMEAITKLLNQNKLAEARQLQLEVKDGLNDLVRLLTQQKAPTLNKQQEMDQLNQWKNEIQKQLRQQQKQTAETRKVANKEKTLQKLQAQIESLNKLAKQQRSLLEKTKRSEKAPLRELDKIADQQFELRKQTENLKKQIGKTGQSSDQAGQNSSKNSNSDSAQDGKPGQKTETGEPADSDADTQKPAGDRKNKTDNPQENTDGDSNQGDENQKNDAKPGNENKDENSPDKKSDQQGSKPDGGESADGKPGQGGQNAQGQQGQNGQQGQQQGDQQSTPQPGEQELQESQQAQANAEEKLGSAKPEDAAASQQKALDKMDEALKKLEKEKRRIESLPPEVLEQMAEDQRRLRDKTMDIAEKIEKSPAAKPNEGQQASDQQDQKPGQQAMQDASQAQQQAAEQMEDQDSEGAEKKQQQAQKKMNQAIDEIEERLAQLKDETREEKLARLEARFKEMLERQRVTSAVTIEIDDKRAVLKTLQTRDQLLMFRMANDESELNESAQQAYDLLLEDGTSFVFPEVVADLQEQLTNAAKLLSDEKTGAYTQLVQQEIESTISDLIDALKQAQNAGSSGGGGGGGGGGEKGEQPLLKKSAELKVLRIQQLRLNRRTKKIDQLKGQPDMDASIILKEQQAAAEFQEKLIEMTDQILEKSSR